MAEKINQAQPINTHNRLLYLLGCIILIFNIKSCSPKPEPLPIAKPKPKIPKPDWIIENKTDMERDLIYEIQLLDTFLELEHSDECEMAIYVAPPPAKEEVEGEEGGHANEASR